LNTQIWAAAGAVIVSILLTMIYQNARFNAREKRIDDRINDLKDWIRSEIRRVEDRIDRIEHPVYKTISETHP
jgi:hypothetical protein